MILQTLHLWQSRYNSLVVSSLLSDSCRWFFGVFNIKVMSTNVRRAFAQLYSGYSGIMVPMGYLAESALERNIAEV